MEQPTLVLMIVGLLATALIVVGFLVLRDGLRTLAGVRRARRWPSTRGRILESGDYRNVDVDRDGRSVWYGVTVRYEYAVAGKRFENDCVSLAGVSFGTQAAADAFLERYPVGGTATVYYDPASPGSSVLVHTAKGTWTHFWLGVTFPLAGAVMLYLAAPVFGVRSDALRLADKVGTAWRAVRLGAARATESLEVYGVDRALAIRETVSRQEQHDAPPWMTARGSAQTMGSFGPHYGIGGFRRLEAANGALANPARLTIGWTPEEVQGLDDSNLAVYRWHEERRDWEFLGGGREPWARRMSVTTTRLGEFTLAPPMPGGRVDLTVIHEPDGCSVVARDIRLNTGEPAPDGTCLQAVLTRDGVYVDGFVRVPTDPVTHGVRGHTVLGALELRMRKVEAVIHVYSCQGTAYGSMSL